MGAVALNRITFDEFERLPDSAEKQELLEGELIVAPPAKKLHMQIAYRLTDVLRSHPLPDSLGPVSPEMGYLISRRSWLKPDISIPFANQEGDDYYEGAPALAIEIISDSNTAEHMAAKVNQYLTHGAIEVWLVYPKIETIWIYREGSATPHTGTFQSALLPGVTIDLASILTPSA